MKIKSKLLLGFTGVVLVIMICSTVAVYLLLNKQNRAAVRASLEKTINLVRDDLGKRQAKQIRDTRQAVTLNKIGENIKFMADFAGQINITRDGYIKTTAALAQFIAAGELWQAAVFDQNGALVSSAQNMADNTLMTVYAHGQGKQTFEHARINAGAPLNEADWQTSASSPITTIAERFSGNPVAKEESVRYVEMDGGLCIQITAPIYTHVYNRVTEQAEPQVFGTVVAWQRLGRDFSATIAKLSGMDLNVFSGQGKINLGSLPAYSQLAGATQAAVDTARSVETQPFVSSEIIVNGAGYFQAALPLHDGTRVNGWLSALVSMETVAANTRQMVIMMSLVYLGCLVVVIPMAYLFAASFSRRINDVVGGLKDIAEGEGDLTRRLAQISKDELGDLARWFNTFIQRLQGIIQEIAGNAGHLAASATGLNELSEKMAARASDMSTESAAVSSASEAVSLSTSSIASAMEQSSLNLSTVAAAAEEMTATINEIVRNTETANRITGKAVDQVSRASQRVSVLGSAAQEIGKVTEAITAISDQTNLLALNATIEAARAGEAGKGFAVVANEIKELAKQTAAATAEIKQKIEGIQQTTEGTVAEIENITTVINEVSQIVTTISTAVAQQSDTTGEIAGNVAQASQGVQEVNTTVAESTLAVEQVAQTLMRVNRASSDMSSQSNAVNDSTHALSRLAEELNRLVSCFRV
ncbi:methyl-accepting chemotaxis protein [Desulfosarcina sp.]|uniref:methyl-accepting chemotaxis protein n=1 Tax=Desulfosarcina sp. TaxID=2027861 RepID=UPI003970AAE9